MMATKTNPGRFFEDFRLGQTLVHATPRTVTEGDRGLYASLYPSRFALQSSDRFAQMSGFEESPLDDLMAFHIAFGKTVPDISLNAVANLGYADCRFLKPIFPGDTLRTFSEVIGLKQNSNGKNGIVYVRSTAVDQMDDPVLTWVRWVMVHKRDQAAAAPETIIPQLPDAVDIDDLAIPEGMDFSSYDFALAGEPHRMGDYTIGEKIDHVDGVTIEEADHLFATRLWQNTAKVHFNTQAREDGRRLIYGGHIISLARALSFNGLANTQMIAGINAGNHVNPCFAGDTVYAWSEVLDVQKTSTASVGAMRLRLVATKDHMPDMILRDDNDKYVAGVLLDLDYWVLLPT